MCVRGRERVLTNRVIKAVVMAGFLLWAAPAGASLTVTPGLTVSNRCNKDIVIAVHYKDCQTRTPPPQDRCRTGRVR